MDDIVTLQGVKVIRVDDMVVWCEVGRKRFALGRGQLRSPIRAPGEWDLVLPRWYAEDCGILTAEA